MSILIKGMEMPESCYYCPFADGVWQKNKRCLINGKEMPRDGRDVQQNHISCPLIELPPHGRLIDADALRLLYDFNGYKPTGDMTEEEFDRLMCRLPVIRANIDDAPTIIESTIGQLNSDSAVNEANANTSNALNALDCVEESEEEDG